MSLFERQLIGDKAIEKFAIWLVNQHSIRSIREESIIMSVDTYFDEGMDEESDKEDDE